MKLFAVLVVVLPSAMNVIEDVFKQFLVMRLAKAAMQVANKTDVFSLMQAIENDKPVARIEVSDPPYRDINRQDVC